jgi:hypothetical protein
MEKFHGRVFIMKILKKLPLAGLAAFLIFVTSPNPAVAGKIRKTTHYSPFFNPVPTSPQLAFFRPPDGDWRITGGVVLRGSAAFYVETEGNSTPVPVKELTLKSGTDGTVTISRNQESYRLDIFPQFACPLGKFIQRGAQIAYTELIGVTQDMVKQIADRGLVDSNLVSRSSNSVAREFYNTPFERLFKMADNAKVSSLPESIARPIIVNLNEKIGGDPNQVFDRFAYVHADFQVTYKIYLVEASKEVDTEGVPLRFHLKSKTGSSPYIDTVEVFAQNWADGAKLANGTDPNQPFSQYDVVWAFQTAAIFREFRRSDKSAFDAFVADACR